MTKIAEKTSTLTTEELFAGIRQARQALGDRVTILGHHYQADEVIQFADYRGDSLELSRRAAEATSRYIVFCGVYFMAETAAILCKPQQIVIQPAIEADCPMARLASGEDAVQAWAALTCVWGDDLLPITYQNSIAEVKAFVGQHGGAVCTSSNAQKLFEWAFGLKRHILFLPDEHLGTNTALAMGIPREEVGVWDPAEPPDPQSLAHCRVIVWKGYCHVHTAFTVEDVEQARAKYPNALIVVHPECIHEVVARADRSGSTTAIIRAVEEAPAGSVIVIGTEWHLVNRLAHEHKDKTIVPLRRSSCPNMAMSTPRHLYDALQGILRGAPRNVVTVDADTAHWARVALERMLQAS
jgi:quinolinate synthase